MAKRFTDTNKWDRLWFRNLNKDYKLLWFFILDKCDASGIWYVDFEAVEFFTKIKFNKQQVLKDFKKQITEINDSSKWFIKDFVLFQYGNLNPANRCHKSVLDILKSNKIDFVEGAFKPLISSLQGAKDKDKEQAKVKVKDKDKEKACIDNHIVKDKKNIKFTKPSLEQIKSYCLENKINIDTEKFFNYYQDNNWKVKVGKDKCVLMQNWKLTIQTWEKNDFGNQKKETDERIDIFKCNEAERENIEKENIRQKINNNLANQARNLNPLVTSIKNIAKEKGMPIKKDDAIG